MTVRYTVLACSRRASCNRSREYTCFACPSNRRVSTILLGAPGFPKSFSRRREHWLGSMQSQIAFSGE
ncbi:hypothetical protein HMPREF1587_01163 [Bifidobacterium breve JCP7499]|nr:hypothetical protein HMPREF1587_01163 [Bifidobacterium breve JCP7499]